jgi:hypothetical protein
MEELDKQLGTLRAYQRARILRGLRNGLNAKQWAFVVEYAIDCNGRRAAMAAEYDSPYAATFLMNKPRVVKSVEQQLEEREKAAELKGAYVRDYILDILEVCPGDYFQPSPLGGWVISIDGYRDLPRNVKRLVEEVLFVVLDGVTMMQVKFISKRVALAMACRYTLLHNGEKEKHSISWDQIAAPLEDEGFRVISSKLESLDAEPVENPT